ncbi:coiled-coil domain-containing protein 33-like, partial [Gigantopelta aegis]|uniref:coiled-coil domain-containing protein 33-like n=1 Tax=Gigantopelta aegis TaxID=1735272 RepID=UPI001B889684
LYINSLIMAIEQKSLIFDVEIHDAQFNHMGRYFIKLSVQSLHTKDYSKIQVKKPPNVDYLTDNEALTDVVRQTADVELCTFSDRKFAFKLPKGFCKNDKNHDVYLLLEVYSLPDNDHDMGKKVGEGKFAIYPRTNAPRINLRVEPGDDMYRYTDVVTMLRTQSSDNIQMHCGRLRCTFALRETIVIPPRRSITTPEPKPKPKPVPVRKPKPKPDPDPPVRRKPVQRTPPPRKPSVTSWGDTRSLKIDLPPSPPPPPLTDGRGMVESPLPENDHSTFSSGPHWRHVANQGKEQIEVILHGATSIPSTPNGRVALPYVSIKTKSEDAKKVKVESRTHCTIHPTHAPAWEEMITMELDEKKAPDETMVLSVGDGATKESLVTYHVPIGHLQPFHQYHLEMVAPSDNTTSGVRMYASIMRKKSRLPKEKSSPNYLALEVYLRQVQRDLLNSPGPLVAVARIVPDYYNYKTDNLLSHPRTAGVGITSVTFPNPRPSSFNVPDRSMQGYPQITLPGHPENLPTWYHPFLFSENKDKATMFTPSAALVIEYYVANQAMTDQFWKVQSPIGFSSLLLDERMYSQLTSENATRGLRIEGLPIQGTEMVTVDGRTPTIGMVLKLVTTDQPDSLVTMKNFDDLPLIDLNPVQTAPTNNSCKSVEILRLESPEPESVIDYTPRGRYVLQRVPKRPLDPIRDGELPPFDAMESILPEYQYIFMDTDRTDKPKTTQIEISGSRAPVVHSTKNQTTTYRVPDDLDATSYVMIDRQSKDLDNYRSAVHRMGQDILVLRQTVRNLETKNSHMRTDMHQYNNTTRLIIDSTEVDGLDKQELASRYATLKQKLTHQISDLKAYKDKVQKLQNELIKKNDKEKEYLKMNRAHASQQELLLRLQEKARKLAKLEEACRKQERVIERLEKLVYKLRGQQPKNDNVGQEIKDALMEENRRLRSTIEDLNDQLKRSGRGGGEDLEKLELYQALERAEGRIMSLEKQLMENARTWGKERADLSIKVNEAEHGLGRSAGMVLHDFPIMDELRCHRARLDPLLLRC